MKLLEYINEIFGIGNEVSAPILITILVFITGGLLSFIYYIITAYVQRKDLREIYLVMIKNIISDCKIKEKQTKRFFPTLTTEHKGNWSLSFMRINYLNTVFELNFNEVFKAFESAARFSCSKRLKQKAFHKIYSNLDNVKYFETFIKPDIENFITDFNNHHIKYKDSISKFNQIMDKLRFDLNGIAITKGNSPIEDYAIITDKVWRKWLELDKTERVHYKTTYKMLVEPTLVINRKEFKLPFTLEMNEYLMDCQIQYIEMENILKRAYLTFKNHNNNYRDTSRILTKCIKILD